MGERVQSQPTENSNLSLDQAQMEVQNPKVQAIQVSIHSYNNKRQKNSSLDFTYILTCSSATSKNLVHDRTNGKVTG